MCFDPPVLPVVLVDERYTSGGAVESIINAGLSQSGHDPVGGTEQKAKERWRASRDQGLKDSIAACLILESVLGLQETEH